MSGVTAIFMGLWFVHQLVEANFGLLPAAADGGGTAFFARVGGFLFGVGAAMALARAGRREDQLQPAM